AVSEHASLSPDGGGRAVAPQGLVALRHGALRVSSEAHDAGGARGRLRRALSAPLLARVDLGAAPARSHSRCSLSRYGGPLQTDESAVAPAHSKPHGPLRVEAARARDAASPPALPRAARARGPRPRGRRARALSAHVADASER